MFDRVARGKETEFATNDLSMTAESNLQLLVLHHFFNLRPMATHRKHREHRFWQGLMSSSPNYSTNDPIACNISNAFFTANFNPALMKVVAKLQEKDDVLNQLICASVLDNETTAKLRETIDCLNAFRHSGFCTNKQNIVDTEIQKIYDRSPAYIVIKKICVNNDQSWPKYSQVILQF